MHASRLTNSLPAITICCEVRTNDTGGLSSHSCGTRNLLAIHYPPTPTVPPCTSYPSVAKCQQIGTKEQRPGSSLTNPHHRRRNRRFHFTNRPVACVSLEWMHYPMQTVACNLRASPSLPKISGASVWLALHVVWAGWQSRSPGSDRRGPLNRRHDPTSPVKSSLARTRVLLSSRLL